MVKKWMQKASEEMERKGTKGAFRKMAAKAGGLNKSGKIKSEFIEKELKSPNPTTRKRASFAKAARSAKR